MGFASLERECSLAINKTIREQRGHKFRQSLITVSRSACAAILNPPVCWCGHTGITLNTVCNAANGREREVPPRLPPESCAAAAAAAAAVQDTSATLTPPPPHLHLTSPHLLLSFSLNGTRVGWRWRRGSSILCCPLTDAPHAQTQTQTRARTHSPDLDSDSVFVSISFEVNMGKKFTGGQTSIIDACSSCVTILQRFCFSPSTPPHLHLHALPRCKKPTDFSGAHLPPCAAHSLSKHPPCMYFETSRAEELFRCWSREREEGG